MYLAAWVTLVAIGLLHNARYGCSLRRHHSVYNKQSMDLMGYKRDQNGKYPLVYGVKWGKIFLACKIHGNRFVRWLRNNNKIMPPPPYSLPWMNGSVLMVRPLLHGLTDGVYECIGSDGRHTLRKGVNISIVEGKVDGFPKILTHPGHVRTFRNNVDFHCVVSGQPKMKIVWFHNRIPLPPSSAYNVSPTTNIGNVFSSNLMIKNVTKETKGFYQCVAMNPIGQAVSKQGNIKFRGKKQRRSRKKKRYHRKVKNDACSFLNLQNIENETAHAAREISVQGATTCKCIGGSQYQQEIHWEDAPNNLTDNYCFVIRNKRKTEVLSKNQKSYMIVSSVPQEEGIEYDILVVGVSRRKTVLSKGSVKTKKCPQMLIIHDDLGYEELSLGSNYTFQLNYTGCPKPNGIVWYFSSDISSCTSKCKLHTCSGSLTCSVINFKENNAGCYVVRADEGDSPDLATGFLSVKPYVNPVEKKNIILPALGGVVGGLLLIASIVLVRNLILPRKVPPISRAPATPVSSVYISHCCIRDQRQRLLMFANILQEAYGIEVILDLTSQVDINRAGGMCQWLPQAMKRADRIMVVLSKSYLGTLNAKDTDPDACKVRAELCEINRIIYHNLQCTNKLVIVADNIRADTFPDPLKGRSSFPLPQCDSLDDMDVRQIAHVLCDQEMYQLPSQQKPQYTLTNNAFENAKVDDTKFEDVAL